MKRKLGPIHVKTIPFILLTIFHLFMMLYLVLYRKKKGFWTLLLSNIGLAYLFEYIIFNLLHAYRYKPSIMKNSIFDSILGAILSQGIYVPVGATFLTLLKKDWRWKVGMSFLYFGIENLFLRLKVYKIYWWKPIYTIFFIMIYFYISDGFNKVLQSSKKWALVCAHFLSIEVLRITIMFIFAYLKKIKFGRGKFHTWTEHFAIAPLYSLLLSIIAVVTSSKSVFLHRLLMIGSQLALDQILIHIGILKINFKHWINYVIWYLHMTFIARLLYKMIYKDKVTT